MSFCQNCGGNLPETSVFCPNCGCKTEVNEAQVPNMSAPTNNTADSIGMQNIPLGEQYTIKRKIPGRGFGISSMVLGIISTVYSSSMLMSAPTYATVKSEIDINQIIEGIDGFDVNGIDVNAVADASIKTGFIALGVFIGIIAVLALIFAICAFTRKYKKGQSIAGLILSVISIIFILIACIIV